jgi:hypothetical protein
MRRLSCLVATALVLLAATGMSSAQEQPAERRLATPDEEPVAAPDRLRAAVRERALTRPRVSPPPLGTPPRAVISAPVQWDEVRVLITDTQRRATGNLTRATTGAPTAGLRSVAPEQLRRVRPVEVDRVSLPVLVPNAPRVLETVQVFGQENAYAAIANAAEGVDLRVSGTRKKLIVERPQRARQALDRLRASRPQLPGMGADYLVTRSESSTDLSFSRFGSGYVLSLICDDPEGDVRCAEDEYIVSLASSMVLLNQAAGDGQ